MPPKIIIKKKNISVDASGQPVEVALAQPPEAAQAQLVTLAPTQAKPSESNEFKLSTNGSLRYFNGLAFTSTSKDKESNKALFAIFDMDGTLIKTKSGKDFAIDADDWEWFSPNVPDKLADYSKRGYNIVIMTNQKGVSQGKTNLSELESKLGTIRTMLLKQGISISVFMATDNDHYRKPLTGMWDTFLELGGFSDRKIGRAHV